MRSSIVVFLCFFVSVTVAGVDGGSARSHSHHLRSTSSSSSPLKSELETSNSFSFDLAQSLKSLTDAISELREKLFPLEDEPKEIERDPTRELSLDGRTSHSRIQPISSALSRFRDSDPESPADLTNWWRPVYHFSPPKNWMNDPNGLIYFEGYWHLFYQWNPDLNTWGHRSWRHTQGQDWPCCIDCHIMWGHARTRDFLSWEHLPLAIAEENGVQAYSGSAVIDYHNTSGLATSKDHSALVAIYTGDLHGAACYHESQNLAVSNDGGFNFTQYRNNPVIDMNEIEYSETNFRDPNVKWYTDPQGDSYWLMVVALPVQSKIQFYKSVNLLHWTLLSSFGPAGDAFGIWECPDFFELPLESPHHHNQTTQRVSHWVLTVNLNLGGSKPGNGSRLVVADFNGGGGMQYFIGNFNGTHFTVDEGQPTQTRWLDIGKDFYAAVTYNFVPIHDGRRILLGWLGNWLYTNAPTQGWRSQMTIPRQLNLRIDEYDQQQTPRLYQTPVVEMTRLRSPSRSHRLVRALRIDADSNVSLSSMLSPSIDSFPLDVFELIASIEATGPVEFGFRIRAAADLSEYSYLGFAVPDLKQSGTVFHDRSLAGNTSFSDVFPTTQRYILPHHRGQIDIRLYVDKSSIELFYQNGWASLTDTIFPNAGAHNHELQWVIKFGSVVIRKLEIHRLDLQDQNTRRPHAHIKKNSHL